jgi:ABC-2 type transport system permease protein
MTRFVTNPMIRKELLQRLREKRAWLLPTLYLLVVAGTALFAYYQMMERAPGDNTSEVQGADIGVAIFLTVIFSQLTVLLVMSPVFSAGSITIEKEQRTLSSVLTSLLGAPQIWWGKFVAALLYLLLLLFSALPLLVLSYTFGGVEAFDFVKTMAVTILVLACICSIGLWCSALFRRSVHATATTYGLVLTLCVITTILFAILASRSELAAISGPPAYVQTPLLFNPFYPLIAVTVDAGREVFSYPLSSCLLFLGIAGLAAGLAMRRIQRSGERL